MPIPEKIIINNKPMGGDMIKKMNHFNVSMIKSALRILAGLALISHAFFISGALFIIAEALGILEEMV
ncbi:MAG: hypothetical protein CMO97_03965 [Woeseia sp.]|nr:hypothetical protein [Woeseia sp.]